MIGIGFVSIKREFIKSKYLSCISFGAGHLTHVALIALLGPLRLGLVVLAHDVVERALEAGGVDVLAPPPVAVLDLDLVVLTAQNDLLGAVG